MQPCTLLLLLVHHVAAGSINDFTIARSATCSGCGVLFAVLSPVGSAPTRAVFEAVLSARHLRAIMSPAYPMALFTNTPAYQQVAAMASTLGSSGGSVLNVWDLHRNLDSLMTPIEKQLVGENGAHGPSLGAAAGKLVALLNSPFERTLSVDVDIWVMRPTLVHELLAHKLILSDIAMPLDPFRHSIMYNAIGPPFCTCLMAYGNSTIIRDQMAAARAGLMRRSHRSVRQSDQEYMWFEWIRRPEIRLLMLPEEYYCPGIQAPALGMLTETALAHGFAVQKTYVPLWMTSARSYPCHSVHTHAINATEVKRLATIMGQAALTPLVPPPPLPLPPPPPPSQANTTTPKGPTTVASLASSSQAWRQALPRFESREALCAEPLWMRYLEAVYGNALEFPIDMQRFLFFYYNYLHIRPPSRPVLSTALEMPLDDAQNDAIAMGTRAITDAHLQKGRSYLDVYLMWAACAKGIQNGCGRATVWVYPFQLNGSTEIYGPEGIADHTRVEVYHCSNARDYAGCMPPGLEHTALSRHLAGGMKRLTFFVCLCLC